MTKSNPVYPVAKAMRSALKSGVNPYDNHAAFAVRWAMFARLNSNKLPTA